MPVDMESWRGPMPDEYIRFLGELGLKEADVLPMLSDRQKIESREGQELLAKLILSLPSASPADLEMAKRFSASISPDANANQLICWLDQQLHEYLEKIDFRLPDGVLATGVYPLRSLRALSVPRQNGVVLLLATGSMEWLEYVVSLTLMTETTTKADKIRFLTKAIQESVGTKSQLPSMKELDGPSWNQMREAIYFGVTWAEWFLLCHEYAHHALGHFRDAPEERYSDMRGEFRIVQFSHVQEYEADLWAMSVLLGLVKAEAPPLPAETGTAFACAAPFYFLGLLELMDQIRRTHSNAYPSAASRILNIELFLQPLDGRKYRYLWWTFNELLDGITRNLVGNELMPKEKIDRSFLIELSRLQHRLRPTLPGMDT